MSFRALWHISGLALAFLPALGRQLGAQQAPASVHGTVRDSAGRPLATVDVFFGTRQSTTNVQGSFSIDSLRAGEYPVTVRRVGYTPIRTRVTLAAARATEIAFVLEPAPLLLPPVITEAHRTGIYGTVSDSSYHAAVGARVQVVGFAGGEVETDGAGRFAFPKADQGFYLLRVTFPGYLERRIPVELARGEGRELAIRLTPGLQRAFRGQEPALQDLRLRLALSFRRDRLTRDGLDRFGSKELCEVPLNAGGNPVIVVNGIDIYRHMPLTFLCFWRADEVDLVEFGPNLCREPSQTLEALLGGRCNRSGSQGGGYIVIWEKR